MNQENVKIKRALISVSDKTHLLEFAKNLVALDIEIISTGGTCKFLQAAGLAVKEVSEITQFPEIMDGRVKSLHPKIHGGILGKRDIHATVAANNNIDWIDLVIVNLYPFAATINNPSTSFEDAIENIDVGGPTMIRAAAKNMEWVGVVVDPQDYQKILEELTQQQTLSLTTRKQLAAKAFAHTARYDSLISQYLQTDKFPHYVTLQLEKSSDLRYGENPHQAASAYHLAQSTSSVLTAIQHQGKQLSYNNIADTDAALACVKEFTQPACVIVKHANPCGAAIGTDIFQAYTHAFNADATSAFGGIVALNKCCDATVAEAITAQFIEVLAAPSYTPEALQLLQRKPNLRVLEISLDTPIATTEFKLVTGGFLLQERDLHTLKKENLNIVTQTKPNEEQMQSLLFAWQVVKHIKSNAILIAKQGVTLGIGGGQVSRIDAVDLAIRKSGTSLKDTVLASDAFFPFRDSIDSIAKTGIRAIIQPGGSMRDAEVITACNEHKIAMIFTGIRCFKH